MLITLWVFDFWRNEISCQGLKSSSSLPRDLDGFVPLVSNLLRVFVLFSTCYQTLAERERIPDAIPLITAKLDTRTPDKVVRCHSHVRGMLTRMCLSTRWGRWGAETPKACAWRGVADNHARVLAAVWALNMSRIAVAAVRRAGQVDYLLVASPSDQPR